MVDGLAKRLQHLLERISLDDSPKAIKQSVWLETDRVYRAAAERLIKIRTNTQVKVAEQDDSDDFSLEEPAIFAARPQKLRFQPEQWAARLKMNGQSMRLDDSTGGKVTYYPFVHSFDALIPQSLFAAHSDYFPLIKGQRKNGYVQRCLSNPELLKLAITNVKGWIKQRPKAMIYSVSQNDCYSFCECDNCKAIEARYGKAHSGLYLWFVNQVAEAIENDHPGKLMGRHCRRSRRSWRAPRNTTWRPCSGSTGVWRGRGRPKISRRASCRSALPTR